MALDVHTISQMNGSNFNRQDRVLMGLLSSVATPPSSTSVTALGSITAGTGFSNINTVSLAPSGGTGSGLTAIPTSVKAVSSAPATPGTGYVPNDTITQAGGTLQPGGPGAASVLTVATTKVVSATVAAGGSGGTNGTQTVTGTTGTGTKFQASVTVAGGAITAVLSISVAGSYTANPTTLTAEPVTGASLTGAQLSVVMGVATVSVSTAGAYAAAPANPVAQASTSGTGTGATFTTVYGLGSAQITSSGNYTGAPSMTVTDSASGTGASIGSCTLGGNGNPIFVPITFDLPASYSVQVEPSMNCTAYVPYASKLNTGFSVAVVPPSGTTLGSGTMDVLVVA
jgi:hypothetical protein